MDRNDLQDLVVPPGQYAYLLDSTKGNVDVLVGPTKTSLSGTDYPVVWNRINRTFDSCSQTQAKQQFPTAAEGYYIVIDNPAENAPFHPQKGTRTNTTELLVGRKVNIPGPCSFALFPGQAADVIEGHHLRSNQYLLVRVYNDEQARASWSQAVVKKAIDDDDTEELVTAEPPALHMGQLILIRGTEVSFYIPPTGIEVVPDDKGKFVRHAETLERLEFCILLREDGEKRYVTGPDVVFPEPTETFIQQSGSRKGRAIELNEISGVYVKVIAYYEDHNPGDELFITGKEQSLYYPRPEHSLIKYGDRIIHYATAIPEGEGRYVLNRKTGKVRIEHGPSMFLPDPREEVIVRRILNESDCDLLYPDNRDALSYNRSLSEAGRVNADTVPMAAMALSEDVGDMATFLRTDLDTPKNISYASTRAASLSAAESMLGDPQEPTQRKRHHTRPRTLTLDTKYDGVVTVDVHNGYAALFTRKNGDRRVVVGPKTVLLEYDERPQVVELSTGTPKTDIRKIKTGFLRVINNSVSDEIIVETHDSFTASIKVRYHLNFKGQTPHDWFNVENYVQFLVERMRSIVRRACKKHDIQDLKDNAIDIIRDLILGESPADGVKRPGREFEENGMHVFDIDVDTPSIDSDIDYLLREAERTSLTQRLELASKERDLSHTQRIEKISQQLLAAKYETQKCTIDFVVQGLADEATKKIVEVENSARVEELRMSYQVDAQDAADTISSRELARRKATIDLGIYEDSESAEIEARQLERQAQAISPALITAIQTLGREELIERLAKAMGPLAILGGESVADVVTRMLKGTGLEEVLDGLGEGFGNALGAKLLNQSE
jgi:major vault protein